MTEENFSADIHAPSGDFVIIDARILEELPEELSPEVEEWVQGSIRVPTKAREEDVMFTAKAEYDESVLKQLIVEPKVSNQKTRELEVHSEYSGPGSDIETTSEGLTYTGEWPFTSVEEANLHRHSDSVQDAIRAERTPKARDNEKSRDKEDQGGHKGYVSDPARRKTPGNRHKAGARKAARNSERKREHFRRQGERQERQYIGALDAGDFTKLSLQSEASREASDFIVNHANETITEDMLREVKHKRYLNAVLDILLHMEDVNDNWVYSTKQLLTTIVESENKRSVTTFLEDFDKWRLGKRRCKHER